MKDIDKQKIYDIRIEKINNKTEKETFYFIYAEDCENEEIKTMFKNAKKNGYSNASDVTEAFGVKIISADSLIEYYEEIRDCNHLNWKIIDKSYKNNNWQNENVLFENLN